MGPRKAGTANEQAAASVQILCNASMICMHTQRSVGYEEEEQTAHRHMSDQTDDNTKPS